MPYKILAINLGSTSTKVAYYEDESCVAKETIDHPVEELAAFATIWDQLDYRTEAILAFLGRHGLEVAELDAVVSRGGHTHPIVGGTYLINERMLEESASMAFGNHACDLGLRIAHDFSAHGPKPFTVDPPVTDEFEPLARYSGIPGIERRSSFHVLNQRAVGRQYAKDVGVPYESLNLIVAHMGGGISVAAHRHGLLVDANNALTGDGPFSTNRCGSVPAGSLADLCYSGKYTHEEMAHLINGGSGLVGYVGESDVRRCLERAHAGDEKVAEAIDAMCYQVAKEIGFVAPVLFGKVDAILFTGGIAYSQEILDKIWERVSFIAPCHAYPGEYEMQSLALNTLAALRGEIETKTFQ